MLWRREPFPGAYFAADFLRRKYRLNGVRKRDVTLLSGWSFARASAAYGTTQGSVLQSFASGVPRITDRGLLVEVAATNLFLQSQTFDNASWTKSNILGGAVSADTGVAPDGTTTADLVVPSTSGGVTHSVHQSVTHTAASWTVSIYAKAGGYSKLGVREGTTSGAYATFALSGSGSVIATLTSTATITALANGWYRCTMTWTAAAVSQQINWFVMDDSYSSGSPHSYNYAGDGSSGMYLWGAQDENSAYATSYIPTTTASVTRAADVISIGSITGLDAPYTLFAEYERSSDAGATSYLLHVDDGDTTDRAALYINSSDVSAALTTAGNVQQSGLTVAGALSVGTVYRSALRVSTNSVQMARGGTLGTEDTSCTNPATPTAIRIGSDSSGILQAHAYLRKLAIIPGAEADAILQARAYA